MKKLLLITACITSLCCSSFLFAKSKQTGEALDQTVAIVNDDVITRSELSHAITLAKGQIIAEKPMTPKELKALEHQVLDQLINKKIQLQMAKSVGIDATKSDIDQAVKRIAEQNHLTISDLYDHLKDEGMSTQDYRRELKEQITLHKLQQREIAGKINITPQEVTNYIRSRAWQMQSTKEYHLQDILIPFSDAPTIDEITTAKQHADAILSQLHGGATFESLTQASSDPSIQGGDLGWRKLSEIPSAFAPQVAHMKANQVAGPIQAPNGFHIVRLSEIRTITDKNAIPSRKNVEAALLQQKFEEAVAAWVSKLRSQAFIVTNT